MGVQTVASAATQQIRIAKETTYGVPPVAVDKKLNALKIVPKPQYETETFTPSGDTAPSLVVVNDSYAKADVAGKLSYTDILYVLGSLFGDPTTTTPVGATLAHQHVFAWDGRTPIAPVSYCVDYGTGTRAVRLPGFLFNGWKSGISRGGLDFSGDAFAKSVLRGISGASTPPFAAAPSDVPAVPIFPLHFDVWVDDSWADLGTTQWLALYKLDLGFGERVARTMPVNSARSSDGIVEKEDQEHTVGLRLGADAVAEALYADIEAGAMKFVRLAATGPEIEGGQNYSLQADLAVLLTGTDGYDSESGVHVMDWSAAIARDPVSGKAAQVTVVNKLAGL